MRTRGIDGAARAALFSVASLSLVTISLSTSLVDGQSADPVRRVRQPVAGTYLVALLRDDDPHSVASETARKFRGRVRRIYRATRGFAIRLPHAAAQVLARDARVAFVEEDGIVAAATVQRRPPSWGLDRIDQRDLPLDDRYRYPASSRRRITIHLIDSGIRARHDEFGGRALVAGDFVDDDGGGTDCFGHGTLVAGVAAGEKAGVAKDALIRSYRVIGCDGTGAWSSVIAAVDEITALAPRPSVVNISLSGGVSTAANLAIRRSIATGLTYVVAAGNQNDDAVHYSPSSVAEAVVVGATTRIDQRQDASNWGPLVDVFAPGEDIASASPYGDSILDINSGTSLAAPHVAGVAALYLQVHPGALPWQVQHALLQAATRDRISDVGAGSPNRLLYSRARVMSGGATPER
jgi:subtilisin family serine protease